MTFPRSFLGGLAVASLAFALGACASDPADKTVASAVRGPAPDCPVGTMLCRRGNNGAPTSSVSADEMRKQGITNIGVTPMNPPPTGGSGR